MLILLNLSIKYNVNLFSIWRGHNNEIFWELFHLNDFLSDRYEPFIQLKCDLYRKLIKLNAPETSEACKLQL